MLRILGELQGGSCSILCHIGIDEWSMFFWQLHCSYKKERGQMISEMVKSFSCAIVGGKNWRYLVIIDPHEIQYE